MQNYLSQMKQHLNNPSFLTFYEMLVEWNKCFNLTAITDKEDVYTKHFLDSLAGEKFLPLGAKVLDVGSGAGFPSIPLKIIREDLRFTLIDSVRKKVNFTQEAVKALNLSGVECVHTRIEDFKCFDYDAVLARAVAPLNVLAEYTLPFLKAGGLAILYKGVNPDEEIKLADKAIKFLGGEVETVERYDLGGGENLRSLIVIKKVSPSPKGYPRKGNKPRTSPL